MATATKYSEGKIINYTPSADVDAGDVVVLGEIVAVATADIDADDVGTVDIKGVFEFPKDTGSGTALTVGLKVYWDATNEIVTTTASTHKVAGYVIEAAATTDSVVKVDLARA